MRRYAAKQDNKDANHDEIVDQLRGRGFYVLEIERPVDIAVHYRGWTGLCEIKAGTSGDVYYRGQLETAAFTPMPFAFVTSANEAVEFATKGRGLTEKQRERIALALIAEPKRVKWTSAMMRKLLT